MRTKLFNAIKVSTLALVLSFGLSFVYAWTAPTVTAPNGNVSAPINTSSTAQTKSGNLNIGGLISFVSNTGSTTVGSLNAGDGNIGTTGNISGWNIVASSITAGATTTTSGLKVLNGAGTNKVLTSDASGNATWQATGGTIGGYTFYLSTYDASGGLYYGTGKYNSNTGKFSGNVLCSTGIVGSSCGTTGYMWCGSDEGCVYGLAGRPAIGYAGVAGTSGLSVINVTQMW